MISETELKVLINRCIRKDLNAQELFYRNFYGFAMGICLRYSSNRYDARTIVNDGFLKVFNNLCKFDTEKPFNPWLSRIMSNTAIDHYRSELKHMNLLEISDVDEVFESAAIEGKLHYEELIKLIQQLPPSYRTVFNLYAIDGFTHEEISKKLKISVGGSKSNLFKARKKLQELLKMASAESDKTRGARDPDYPLLRVTK
ncbi:MAG: RNA polymerase sigma factor [Daejeonella sp.]